jgi:predicted HicB family RNase H-like nuclease
MAARQVGRAPKQNGETRSATVGLRIKPSLKAALERLARTEERTLNFYIERIIEAHVQEHLPEPLPESTGHAA